LITSDLTEFEWDSNTILTLQNWLVRWRLFLLINSYLNYFLYNSKLFNNWTQFIIYFKFVLVFMTFIVIYFIWTLIIISQIIQVGRQKILTQVRIIINRLRFWIWLYQWFYIKILYTFKLFFYSLVANIEKLKLIMTLENFF
jgi:hypothetical protein